MISYLSWRQGLISTLILGISMFGFSVYAQTPVITVTTIAPTTKAQAITLQDAFIIYFNELGKNLPDSRQYITVYYTGVPKNTALYQALQKGIMMGLIDNKPVRVNRSTPLSQTQFATLIENHTAISVYAEQGQRLTRDQLLSWIDELPDYFEIATQKIYGTSNNARPITDIANFGILNDAYLKIIQEYISGSSLDPETLIQGAIMGMTDIIGDKHSSYFPPVESQSFSNDIHGQVEGIGAYIEMNKPGQLIIVSPLDDSPAEKAGLLPGDRIISIGSLVISDDIDLATAVSYIKGPAGTSVTLTVQRGTQTLTFTITRAKITIHAVVTNMLPTNDAYIQIRQFNIGMITERQQAMNRLSQQSSVRNIILDLRNNPGGSLQDVVDVLSTIIPIDQPTVAIQFAQGEQLITSAGQISYRWGDKNIKILINKGTASAAEILALGLKDYFPQQVTLIGEKTFGKGSVQTIYDYDDGSSIKLTIAKRLSGKSRTSIDGKGITPDIRISDNRDTTQDEQLDLATK